MKFRQCFIGGKVYTGGIGKESTADQTRPESPPILNDKRDIPDIYAEIPLTEMSASGSSHATKSPPQNASREPEKPDLLTSAEAASTVHAPPHANCQFYDNWRGTSKLLYKPTLILLLPHMRSFRLQQTWASYPGAGRKRFSIYRRPLEPKDQSITTNEERELRH
jgi:hypothetical protein